MYDKDTAALQLRKEIFTETHKMIVEHNNNGVKAFALEHNIFSIVVKKSNCSKIQNLSNTRFRQKKRSKTISATFLHQPLVKGIEITRIYERGNHEALLAYLPV